jgi:hypothetical protein
MKREPSSWEYNWATLSPGDIPGPTGWRSLESETVKYGHESRGTRTRERLRWRGQAAIVNDKPIPSSERMLRKNYDRKCLVQKKIGRGSQKAWRHGELIGGKPPVVK